MINGIKMILEEDTLNMGGFMKNVDISGENTKKIKKVRFLWGHTAEELLLNSGVEVEGDPKGCAITFCGDQLL